MKKFIYLTLTFVIILSLGVYVSKTKNSNSNTNNDNSGQITNQEQSNTETQQPTYSGKITEDVLRSYPENPASDFMYGLSLKYDGIEITDYLGTDDIVVVPSEINGQPVVEVSGMCFGNNSTVRGVVLPKTVTIISGVFANNEQVEMVIAEGLKEIGYSSFLGCTSLHTIILRDQITSIGESAFGHCFALKELHLSTPLVNPNEDDLYLAFFGCTNLTIYGKKGSVLESIANELEIPFVSE